MMAHKTSCPRSPTSFSTEGQTLSSHAQPACPAMQIASGQYRLELAESENLQKSIPPNGATTHLKTITSHLFERTHQDSLSQNISIPPVTAVSIV